MPLADAVPAYAALVRDAPGSGDTVIDFHAIPAWIAGHPQWAIATIFVVALAESLALVGIVIPGALAMLAAGALVGIGAIAFWPTLFAAAAGAIVGDALSFWLGRRYGQQLRGMWPFRRYGAYLSLGEGFIRRHGGKSIVLARFVGPVRPIVPAVAGMLGMRPATFALANVLSALIWAPTYLLPGLAFGASLALAGQVATRLVVLLVLLAATALAIWFVVRWLFVALQPRAARWATHTLARLERRPLARRLFAGLIDPAQPEQKSLLVLGALLIGSAWVFLTVLEDVVTGDPLVRIDQALYQFLQALRTPIGDRMMTAITELGDGVFVGILTAAVLGWLLWRRAWRAAVYWLGAIAFGQLASAMLKLALQRHRPAPDLYEGLSSFAFPSGHATMSTVAYGFVAVLVAWSLPASRRWLAYWAAALLVGAISLSRLYLGAHWLSDVLGGLSLGLAWVSLLALGYHRHAGRSPHTGGLASVVALTLALGGGAHIALRLPSDLERYAPRIRVERLASAAWWEHAWQTLPSHRHDLGGELEQPLNLQWAGTLESVQERLAALGWNAPPALSAASALQWLAPEPELGQLPVLPQIHAGKEEALRVTQPAPAVGGTSRQFVLRLWPSATAVDPGGVPVWIGNVSLQRLGHTPLLKLPVGDGQDDESLSRLERALVSSDLRLATRVRPLAAPSAGWSGRVLLVRETPAP